MKDIELIKNRYKDTYDWHFVNGDLSVVNGVTALRNSVIHAVMLRYNELNQEIYKGKGSTVHQYIKAKPSQTMLDYMKESVIATVKELDGVYDATVTVESDNVSKAITNITITKTDGTEVIIGAV